MTRQMFGTPILLIIFNRPEQTRLVLNRLREIMPATLYVVADGPRHGNLQDEHNCKLARQAVTSGIDWPCEVKTLFREQNLGCGLSPSDGITWFFQHEEEGIILEDDCLPSISFFNFCKVLLHYYRDNRQVMHISGNNFQNGNSRSDGSYYFSAYTHNWGWATWRDRWGFFKFEMEDYDDSVVASTSQLYGFGKEEIVFWQKSFRDVITNNKTDIWDFRWMYAVWKNNGLTVLPNVNLVRNIGFGQQATHTQSASEDLATLKANEIGVIVHSNVITVHTAADRFSFKNHFNHTQSGLSRIMNISARGIRKIKTALLPIKGHFQFSRFGRFTMIPKITYVSNLELCWKFKNILGDVVECGTWKGGMIAGMVDILGKDRTYYLFDSFEGLPEVKEIDGLSAKIWQSSKDGVDYFDNCKAEESDAREAMALSGAKHYHIRKGWFSESLKEFSTPNGISVLRLDADWYDSTMDCLVALFPKINLGGVLILDDYYTWEGCSKAIHDYLSAHKLPYRVQSYKGICYIVKK